jgi:heme/copper-type cytochrome/quinol oxidase subunit 1
VGTVLNSTIIFIFFIIIFLGVNTTFFPLHFSGLQGYPRKYMDYADIYGL